jgi:hypothetical protein
VSELNKHTGWQQGQYIRLPKYEKLSQGWHEESERLERERVRPSPTGNAICVTFEPDMAKWIAERLNTAAQLESKLATLTAERDALLGMLSCLKHHHMTKPGIARLVQDTEAAIDAAKGGAK